MQLRSTDAIIPLAVAVATAIPKHRGRALCTVATVAAGQLAVDHFERDQPGATLAAVQLDDGDVPGLRGRLLDIANSALTGGLLGLIWLAPVALARKLPPLVAPAAAGLAAVGIGVANHVVADRAIAAASAAAARRQGPASA